LARSGCQTSFRKTGYDTVRPVVVGNMSCRDSIVHASARGGSTWTVILSIAATRVAYGTRIIRSQALAVKEVQYVEAARGLGSSSWRIIFWHIAPQCIGPYLVLITTSLGIAIVLEATLGFLGAGIPPPTPTWGNMLGDAASMLIPQWHLVVFPGAAIVIAVLAFNQFGDGLRDALDPRLRGTNLKRARPRARSAAWALTAHLEAMDLEACVCDIFTNRPS
jgi:ABC-type dipeptide/oligopeptide/nickel transport system permease subunit